MMHDFNTMRHSQRPGMLSLGVLYLCMFGLINTIFFPTIQESLSSEVSIHAKTDSSLMEVILETFFDVSDDGTEHQDDEDDLLEKEQYIIPTPSLVSRVAAFAERKRAPRISYSLSTPTLEKTTPPPKYS
ncbi:hypothetical protein [Chryseolinea lacunae]|uniref:Energy transducer TonB n=1 Tax=Chryseolinea lacunae TaxID=2801331 RepID=A0ABS1KV94_9BACT|nr:hypothetical protein [Chryseolinea lacunae]MBL0743142.1 hypothetical protein [Chryseolinea lacunae]